ncbi:MAG TPA: N-(5'-phosphoribosyl)anthranilate isomerase [Saprospirales bacterium]|nr:N-(5'-phosphoribosyl)anthranilate isomerase [Saprospirales bacterium]
MIRVKICCISSEEEAQTAISAGAAALGLVGAMPSGPGIISDDLIAQIAAKVPTDIATFLLTSETKASDIIQHNKRVGTNTIQIVDALQFGTYAEIREALPGIKLVQVIHVTGEESLEEALIAAEWVDFVLLDSGNPTLAVKELGGTGRTHNWQISRKIVAQSPVPVFLAGGLNPDNVREAIEAVQPYGLDLCSGVRTEGKLDPWKLERFFAAVNA